MGCARQTLKFTCVGEDQGRCLQTRHLLCDVPESFAQLFQYSCGRERSLTLQRRQSWHTWSKQNEYINGGHHGVYGKAHANERICCDRTPQTAQCPRIKECTLNDFQIAAVISLECLRERLLPPHLSILSIMRMQLPYTVQDFNAWTTFAAVFICLIAAAPVSRGVRCSITLNETW